MHLKSDLIFYRCQADANLLLDLVKDSINTKSVLVEVSLSQNSQLKLLIHNVSLHLPVSEKKFCFTESL